MKGEDAVVGVASRAVPSRTQDEPSQREMLVLRRAGPRPTAELKERVKAEAVTAAIRKHHGRR
jgi:hypothetical protein